MQRFRFPLAVLGTSLALVALLVVVGGFVVGNAVAAGFNGWSHAGGAWGDLPPELTGLRDIPAADRFAHFQGVQVSLTDKDNHPLNLSVTPGTVNAVSATSLTVSGNDGSARTYAIDGQTIVRGPRALAQGEKVVVATLNGSQTALAVMTGDPHNAPLGH